MSAVMNGGAESASDVSYASESVTGAAGACSHAEARPPPAAPWRPRAPADEVELAALLAEVRGCSRLPEVPFPTPPAFGRASLVPVSAQLWAFQQYITSLEYNHTGTSYFPLRKDRGLTGVITVAKDITVEALPIQCVEAVFLAIHFTHGMVDVERVPVSFKSSIGGHVFRHIVLALRYREKWGAMGLSRKSTLMYKDLKFVKFSDLMLEYRRRYEECGHTLLKIYVGLPLDHLSAGFEKIQWKVLSVHVDAHSWSGLVQPVIDRYMRDAHLLAAVHRATGQFAEHDADAYCAGPACCGEADSDFEYTRPAVKRRRARVLSSPREGSGLASSAPLGRRVARDRAPDVSPIRTKRSSASSPRHRCVTASATSPRAHADCGAGGGGAAVSARNVTLPPIPRAPGDGDGGASAQDDADGGHRRACPHQLAASQGGSGGGDGGMHIRMGGGGSGTSDDEPDGIAAEGGSTAPSSMAFLAV